MHGNLNDDGSRAINGHGSSAADECADGKSAVDDADWFSRVARTLLPNKAGTALHYVTGFDERLCQRYAAGHVKPPAYFFRSLLRSEQGGVWLAAAMEGSEAAWWLEVQDALRIKRAIENR